MATMSQAEGLRAAHAYINSRLANGPQSSSIDGSVPFIIPTIDISSTFDGSLDDRREVAAQVRQACTTSGFVHVTGHGITEGTYQAVLQLAKRSVKASEQRAEGGVARAPFQVLQRVGSG